jgi:pimeloyl-ACP methyl ester carboxylesterase
MWKAPPILVSGAVAYSKGEFIYQDYLFDDYGAKGRRDDSPQPYTVSPPQGSYTYPRDPDYHGNAADIVEVRLREVRHGLAVRVTFNTMTPTMVRRQLVALTIALGRVSSPVRDYPFGANVRGPADVFVTVHGSAAEVTGAKGRASLRVDTRRSQVIVEIPQAVWSPGDRFTVAVGAGLWDATLRRYLVPAEQADERRPGGGGGLSKPAAFFNVAFRNEPRDCCLSFAWRDNRQANTLAVNDMTPFTRVVDRLKLASGVNDDSSVPRTGALNRIMSSHFATGTGVDWGINCGPPLNVLGFRFGSYESPCRGQHMGRLQPYAVYVPPDRRPAKWGLTLLLHAHNANHNQFSNGRNAAQLASRGSGYLILTPLARGHDGYYVGYALADVFEAWADLASRYRLDPARTAIAGYSMGGAGVYQLAQAYPDLFAAAFVEVGSNPWRERVRSLRHIPVMQWNVVADEFGPLVQVDDARAMIEAGNRYELDNFPGEHLTLAINDEWGPGVEFLGDRRVVSNPARVTYVVAPDAGAARLGLGADHAYWISGLRLRSPERPGLVDALSRAPGVAEPVPSGAQAGAGVLVGGLVPLPYTRTFQTWLDPAQRPGRADHIDIELANVAAVTIDLGATGLSCRARVQIKSDGAADVVLLSRSGPGPDPIICRRAIRVSRHT